MTYVPDRVAIAICLPSGDQTGAPATPISLHAPGPACAGKTPGDPRFFPRPGARRRTGGSIRGVVVRPLGARERRFASTGTRRVRRVQGAALSRWRARARQPRGDRPRGLLATHRRVAVEAP